MKLYYKTGNTTLNMPISYASIMLDALSCLLCPILCCHNWQSPVTNKTYACDCYSINRICDCQFITTNKQYVVTFNKRLSFVK